MSKIYKALKKAEKEKKDSIQIMEIEKFISKEPIKEERPSEIDDLVIAWKDPESEVAEQFRKLCMKILTNFSDKKVILITSALPLEGKTVVTANLGVCFAQLPESYVLLIDADLRKPSLHKLLGMQEKKGLSEYLQKKVKISEIFYKTLIPKLSLIPAGKRTKSPAELLSSSLMRNLVAEVKNRYPDRYILIDSTPILLTSEPDILVKQVDGIILVVQYGKTPKNSLERALLSLPREKILGIVFNRVDFKLLKYKYGYSYYRSKDKKKKI